MNRLSYLNADSVLLTHYEGKLTAELKINKTKKHPQIPQGINKKRQSFPKA